jgi:PleD family two-component response regulator
MDTAHETSLPGRRFFAIVGESNDWALRALASILVPNGFEVVRARTVAQLVDRSRTLRPDLVVVGETLGGVPATEACRILRSMSTFNLATPVLVATTSLVREEQRIEHLRAGAWDTIRVPTNTEELVLRIRRFVEAKILADLAQDEGMLDLRSGFYNLRGLLRRTEEEASEAWRFRRPLSCVVFGMERSVEETLLRGAEEQPRIALEKDLVEVFRRASRRSDVIGRLSVTDFIVLAPSTDEEGAVLLAERLLAEMLHLSVPFPDGSARKVRMKAGYYSPGDPVPSGVEPAQMVSRAAGALRRAQSLETAEEAICSWRVGDEAPIPFSTERGGWTAVATADPPSGGTNGSPVED